MGDHEVQRVRLWTWNNNERISQITLAAAGDSVVVTIGPDAQPPSAQHTLSLADLDLLMGLLPALRNQVASGLPAPG